MMKKRLEMTENESTLCPEMPDFSLKVFKSKKRKLGVVFSFTDDSYWEQSINSRNPQKQLDQSVNDSSLELSVNKRLPQK